MTGRQLATTVVCDLFKQWELFAKKQTLESAREVEASVHVLFISVPVRRRRDQPSSRWDIYTCVKLKSVVHLREREVENTSNDVDCKCALRLTMQFWPEIPWAIF